jgi:hypothetical protein
MEEKEGKVSELQIDLMVLQVSRTTSIRTLWERFCFPHILRVQKP